MIENMRLYADSELGQRILQRSSGENVCLGLEMIAALVAQETSYTKLIPEMSFR